MENTCYDKSVQGILKLFCTQISLSSNSTSHVIFQDSSCVQRKHLQNMDIFETLPGVLVGTLKYCG